MTLFTPRDALRARLPALAAAVFAACAGDPSARTAGSATTRASTTAPATASPVAPEMKPPQFALGETRAERLGTVPTGLGLAVGSKAPDATLMDITGATKSLAALYAEGATLVLFYRGGWCPFCNLQIHDFAKAKPEFEARGVHLVAISVDKPSEEAKTQAKHDVPFPMLSDSKLVAHQAYRVVHVPGEAERQKLAGYKIDLAAYSGEAHGSFAVPAIYLVDKAGVIRFVHIDEDYKTRPSAKQMLGIVARTYP